MDNKPLWMVRAGKNAAYADDFVEHYDSFTPEGLALIPLKRIYWPIV